MTSATSALPMAFSVEGPEEGPVIAHDHPDTWDNRYGFEGGTVVKVDGIHHLFTAEIAGDPFWVRMRLAHRTSPDTSSW